MVDFFKGVVASTIKSKGRTAGEVGVMSIVKVKTGSMFGIGGVKDILMNPVYIGNIRCYVRENWSEKRKDGTTF